MFIISILFCLYFFVLLMFSLASHPIYYCVLLVISALTGSLMCYSVYGFGWYSVMFCLVYIGGVYILFVFVSVFNPNNNLVSYSSFNYSMLSVVLSMVLVLGSFILYNTLSIEFSECICTPVEGSFYVCMCFGLVFGFMMLSIIVSIKINHFR
nr:NADH dehydrogenase subunit 6 [Raillietina sp. HL-2022]